MNIGIITNSYPPNLNGVSLAVWNLQQALEAKGHKVFIATPKIPGLELKPNILAISSAPTPKYISSDLRFPINFTAKTTKFFKQNNVQVIHSQDTIMGGLEATAIANKLNIPCIHTYHTLIEDYEYFKFPGYKQFIRSYSQIVCDSHDGIVVLSDKIEDYLKKIGISAPTYRLPNIFKLEKSTEEGSPKVREFISKHHLDKTFNIIIFGRVAKEKSIQASIDLLKPILNKHSDVRFIIAGDGPELKLLQESVKKEELTNRVLFFGRYERSELSSLCKTSKIFLITSRSEVLPTTPLEAMLNGLVVVAADDLAYRYLCDKHKHSFMLEESEMTSCIEQLYIDRQKIKSLSNNALHFANNYIKQDIAEKYITTYQHLIDTYEKKPFFKTLIIANFLKGGSIWKNLPNTHL